MQALNFLIFQLATEESKNFVERNIYVVLVPNKIAIQKEQDELNRKDTAKEEKDQSDSDDELLTEQLEESKEPEAEVSANVWLNCKGQGRLLKLNKVSRTSR